MCYIADGSGLLVTYLTGVRNPRIKSHHEQLCLLCRPLWYTASGMGRI